MPENEHLCASTIACGNQHQPPGPTVQRQLAAGSPNFLGAPAKPLHLKFPGHYGSLSSDSPQRCSRRYRPGALVETLSVVIWKNLVTEISGSSLGGFFLGTGVRYSPLL